MYSLGMEMRRGDRTGKKGILAFVPSSPRQNLLFHQLRLIGHLLCEVERGRGALGMWK